MGEIQNLSKQIDFNDLINCFKGESVPNKFVGFYKNVNVYKSFYKNIKKSPITLRKTKRI